MNIFKVFILFIFALLAGCGGDSESDDRKDPPSRQQGTITGNVYDAPVSGATVYIWEYDNGNVGKLLAQTTTDAFGNYSTQIQSSSRPLLVSAQGGAYVDPLTGEAVSESNGKSLRFDTVMNFSEGYSHDVMITPLTNMAAGLAKYKIANGTSGATAIDQAQASIDSMYGFNVKTTWPIDITRGGQSSFASPGHKYGALLTAYSSYAYDLINAHGNSDNVYTSFNLADIQYRDISSDGQLNGREVNQSTGFQSPLTFGQQLVTSDIYTNGLAQHVLVVVNDPSLNLSGTPATDYVEFSDQINSLGTGSGSDGAVPPRDEIPIDTDAPVAVRTDSAVLANTDKIDVQITDEIGVHEVSAYLQFKSHGAWSEEFVCPTNITSGAGYCEIMLDDFERGARVSNIHVKINTQAVDNADLDYESNTSNVTDARIIVYAEDVLGNKTSPSNNDGDVLDFEWDNLAPVIEIKSATTINNTAETYVLHGVVKEESQDITKVEVIFRGGLPEVVDCTPISVEVGSQCEFMQPYSTEEFTSQTQFEIFAEDTQGNVGRELFTVSRDDTDPEVLLSFPNGNMMYVEVDGEGDRTTIEAEYSQYTYTEETVKTANNYLKIDYSYAANGLKPTIPEADFRHFNSNLLNENRIPYVKVVVSDPHGESVIGSPADKLRLVVEYYVSTNNDGDYGLIKTTSTVASTDNSEALIPHETIDDSGERVNEIVYYVPFVREILGDNFRSVSENSGQKLVIKTIDESDNVSKTEQVYFRSTFDLPTITVTTPFVNATARLEGLSANGDFTPLVSCTTRQLNETGGNPALDLASCSLTTDMLNYEFMRVRLESHPDRAPYYYNWEDSQDARTNVDFSGANFGAYFPLNGSQTVFINELSTYTRDYLTICGILPLRVVKTVPPRTPI
ncbi:hypothetical protein [Vibrio mexicanus]|uniref:hypothetical protein n=1 Tax=Vibrio mexicanus TaxID=1004326 RepID=UPI00069C8C26|nr:hypothetical protein [Vibrio mexicanus]